MKIFRKIAKKCKDDILEVCSSFNYFKSKIVCLPFFLLFQNGSRDFEILVTILRGLDELLQGQVDAFIHHSRHAQRSSDDDDSDDEHDRTLKRLHSHEESKTTKVSDTHDALNRFINDEQKNDFKNSEISDSESSTNDGNSHVDKKSRLENNFDDDDGDENDGGRETNHKSRNSLSQTENHYQQFGPLSQTQTEICDNTKKGTKKKSREARLLSSYNHSPLETTNHETIQIEKPQHRHKQKYLKLYCKFKNIEFIVNFINL